MNPGLRNGLILGLISIVLFLIVYLIDPRLLSNPWYMLLGFILLFGFMAKACIDARNEGDGFISFGGAFMAAWLTAIVSMIMGMIFQYVMNTFVDPSLIEIQQEASLEWWGGLMESWGAMDKEEFIEQSQANSQDASNPFFMLIGIICGSMFMAIPAAIYGLIFKRENNTLMAE